MVIVSNLLYCLKSACIYCMYGLMTAKKFVAVMLHEIINSTMADSVDKIK